MNEQTCEQLEIDKEHLRRVLSILPGGCLPSRYICMDIETTGFDPKNDLLVQVGHCVVKDKQASSYHEHVLNWYGHNFVSEGFLLGRLQRCKEGMLRSAGRWHGIDVEVMQNRGEKPELVLQQLSRLLLRARQLSYPIVGHGFIHFDARRIQEALQEWTGIVWTFRENELIDTGGIEKALLLEMEPLAGENHFAFAKRVMARRAPGVKYNLPGIVERYRLAEKYDLSQTDMHTAGGDSVLCHLYLEELRRLAGL